jgi:hypothetical protein
MSYVSITITLPEKIVNKIDCERGDINRSRYILRLLEQSYSDIHADGQEAVKKDAGGYRDV